MNWKAFLVLILSSVASLGLATPTIVVCDLSRPNNGPGWPPDRIEFDLHQPMIRVIQVAPSSGGKYEDIPVPMVDEQHASGYQIPIKVCQQSLIERDGASVFEYHCVHQGGVDSTDGRFELTQATQAGTYLVKVSLGGGMDVDPSQFEFNNCRSK